MARHSSGKNNYALSRALIVAIVALVVVIALVTAFFMLRNNSSNSEAEGPTCVAGDLELPVAASDEKVGQQLVDDYADANRVVRDYCVHPVLVASLTDAAVYVAPDVAATHETLKKDGRSAATSDLRPVYAEQLGVAGKEAPADGAGVTLSDVVFPVAEDPTTSVFVATVLADTADEAVEALTQQRTASLQQGAADGKLVATTEDNVPEGLTFTDADASMILSAIPLNQTETVSEDQARAAQDFATVLADAYSSPATQPDVPDSVWEAATAADTLYVLDTSDAMAPFFSAASQAIAESAADVIDDGHQVALWNYSSPLSADVVNGYRRNLGFVTDAAEVAQVASLLEIGGQPQTREAVTAALSFAEDAGTPTRVVVLTTGTSDPGDDDALVSAVDKAAAAGVTLSVVHIGDGEEDETLRKNAAVDADAEGPDDIAPALAKAMEV